MPKAKAKATRPIALVTGASMGIGLALAEQFAGHGYDVILVARSVEKLAELAQTLRTQYGCQVWVEPADLAQPQAAQRLHATLSHKGLQVEVLVNCAGVLDQNPFVAQSPQTQHSMVALNVMGLTNMLSYFVPDMAQRKAGRVLNVASIAAFQPIPMLATYAATKAYVLSLSESLAEELRGSGITVTALCPGMTATNMLKSAAQANAQVGQIPDFLISNVDDVAKDGFEACMRGDAICIPGWANRAAMLASRSTPKWLVRRIGGLLGKKGMK